MNMFIGYEYVHCYEYDLQTMNISPNPQVIRASGPYKMEVLGGIRRLRTLVLIFRKHKFLDSLTL